MASNKKAKPFFSILCSLRFVAVVFFILFFVWVCSTVNMQYTRTVFVFIDLSFIYIFFVCFVPNQNGVSPMHILWWMSSFFLYFTFSFVFLFVFTFLDSALCLLLMRLKIDLWIIWWSRGTLSLYKKGGKLKFSLECERWFLIELHVFVRSVFALISLFWSWIWWWRFKIQFICENYSRCMSFSFRFGFGRGVDLLQNLDKKAHSKMQNNVQII